MKLSKREKLMLSILALVVVIYLGYTFGYTKLESQMDTVKAEYNNIHDQYDKAVSAVEIVDTLRDKEIDKTKEVNVLCQKFFDNMEQESVILYIKELIDKNNIKANTLSFSERFLAQNAEQQNTAADTQSTESIKDNTASIQTSVRVTDINMSYEASYNNLINFINSVQSFDREISISNITAVVSDSSKLVGSMSISLYGIENPYSTDKYTWKDVTSFGGRQNPFYLQQSAIESFNTNSKKYDFAVSVKPTSSDLPTVIVQKNQNSQSAIYEDSNLVENINFSIKEENGKYYYMYSTANNKYPSNKEWEEFVPESNSSINMKIYSCARNSSTDTSGVKITITNNTGIECAVDVFDDDSTRPRVQIDATKGVKINNGL